MVLGLLVAALSLTQLARAGSGPAVTDDAAGAAAAPNVENQVDEMDAVIDLNRFVPELQARLGARFGYVRIDRRSVPGRVVVGVVGPTAADAATAERTEPRALGRIDIVATPLSAGEVARLQGAVIDVLQAADVAPAKAAFDRETHRFVVTTRELREPVAARIRQIVPDSLLDLVTSPDFNMKLAHVSRNQYPEYEAGLMLTLNGGGLFACTSAFTIYSALTAQYYGTTAGHCGNTGTTVAIGSAGISNIGTNSFYNREPSNSDAARFFIPAAVKTNRVYTAGINGHRPVTAQQNNAGLGAGYRLCYIGITSGADNCGNIQAGDVDFPALMFNIEGTLNRVEHMWCIDAWARAGDSGGPVYHVEPNLVDARAAGIVSAVFDENPDPNVTEGDMCFTSIEHSLAELNGTLVTS